MIKEMIEDYHNNGNLPKLSNENDPFWDPADINIIKTNKDNLEKTFKDDDDDKELLIIGKDNMH